MIQDDFFSADKYSIQACLEVGNISVSRKEASDRRKYCHSSWKKAQ